MTKPNSDNSQTNLAKGYWIVLAEINEPSRFSIHLGGGPADRLFWWPCARQGRCSGGR